MCLYLRVFNLYIITLYADCAGLNITYLETLPFFSTGHWLSSTRTRKSWVHGDVLRVKVICLLPCSHHSRKYDVKVIHNSKSIRYMQQPTVPPSYMSLVLLIGFSLFRSTLMHLVRSLDSCSCWNWRLKQAKQKPVDGSSCTINCSAWLFSACIYTPRYRIIDN